MDVSVSVSDTDEAPISAHTRDVHTLKRTILLLGINYNRDTKVIIENQTEQKAAQVTHLHPWSIGILQYLLVKEREASPLRHDEWDRDGTLCLMLFP